MSDQEKFLARWSRRKLEPADKQAPEESPPAADAPPVESAPPAPKAEAPEFDISTLPSLDSIGAKSDIRAFLQAGVPSALRHAALRRAWSADPAIRDYIGPNENFWEGVGPGGVPGFGELDPEARHQEAGRRGVRRGRTGTARGDRNGVANRTIQRAPTFPVRPRPRRAKRRKANRSHPPHTTPILCCSAMSNVASHHDDPQQGSGCLEAAAPWRGNAGVSRGIIPRLFDYL